MEPTREEIIKSIRAQMTINRLPPANLVSFGNLRVVENQAWFVDFQVITRHKEYKILSTCVKVIG